MGRGGIRMNKLSDGEWKLMELLWEESPVNSTRLVERCRELSLIHI